MKTETTKDLQARLNVLLRFQLANGVTAREAKEIESLKRRIRRGK